MRTALDVAKEQFAKTGLTPIPAICAGRHKHEWIDGNGNGAIRAPSLRNCRCFWCGEKLLPHPDHQPRQQRMNLPCEP